jgi:transcriptional antiterminator
MTVLEEKKFTITELAEELKSSKSTIQRLFNDEPGTQNHERDIRPKTNPKGNGSV